MQIKKLLAKLDYELLAGKIDAEVKALVYDSRKISPGAIFVCIKGTVRDGHDFIPEMMGRGAVAFVVERDDIEIVEGYTYIKVENTRIALAELSAAFFGYPAEKLKIIGITGTKGKTTTSYLIKSILESAGIKTGLIGTIKTVIGEKEIPSVNTTPESYLIQEYFRKMVDSQIEVAVMEVSSQALKMHRVDGFTFDIGVFTNIEPDHIGGNEHIDFTDYMHCKSLLLQKCRLGIVNGDSEYLEDVLRGHTCEIKTYGCGSHNEICASQIQLLKAQGRLGVRYHISKPYDYEVGVNIPGLFSVYNSLAATMVCSCFNVDSQKIKSLEGVDIVWIEEGQTISKKSWDILSPTIRKDGSEIWISMNRNEENDALWSILAANPDDRTLVVKVNYNDNPFCPNELKIQAQKCLKENPDDYAHIWLGQPISQSASKLISSADVRKAFDAKISYSDSPLVIGLDIARFGDDSTVFCFRRGRHCQRFEILKKQDVVSVANYCQGIIQAHNPARVFLDVGGIGAGVYDILYSRGFRHIIRAINFGSKAILEDRYVNRRAEMWDNARAWLTQELSVQIPNDDGLLDELCSVNKKYDSLGRLLLESKDEIKKRLGRSPDKADAFVLTFAEPVYDYGKTTTYGNGQVVLEDMFANQFRESKW